MGETARQRVVIGCIAEVRCGKVLSMGKLMTRWVRPSYRKY